MAKKKKKMTCGLPSPNGRSCSVGMTGNEMKNATIAPQSKGSGGRANTVQKGGKSFKMYQVGKGFSK